MTDDQVSALMTAIAGLQASQVALIEVGRWLFVALCVGVPFWIAGALRR